ncbi:MAG: hypothetical protein ABIC95_02595 [archaeon]
MAEALCPYFGRCGGCRHQEIPYEEQLGAKITTISGLLGVSEDEIAVFSGEPYHYRNRMDFNFAEQALGLRVRRKWWETVDIERCEISNEQLNGILLGIREHFVGPSLDAFDVKQLTGTFRYAVTRATTMDSSVTFILAADSPRLSEARSAINSYSNKTSSTNVLVGYVHSRTDVSVADEVEIIKGDGYLHESVLGKTLAFPCQDFFQNNPVMAEKMVAYVRERLGSWASPDAVLLDLYGGVGTFGIACADLFKEVVVIESVGASIVAAERNIVTNDVQNAKALLMETKRIKDLTFSKPLYVVTDPPRGGMGRKAITRMLDHGPEKVIYVCCGPKQLATELPVFDELGYGLESVALFDLFPQTDHCEVVVVLQKT